MTVKIKFIAGRVSALALILSALAQPAAAAPPEEGSRVRDNEAAGNIGGDDEPRRARRSALDEGDPMRPARAASRTAPAGDYQQGRGAQAPGWNRSAERREGNGWNGNGRSWENRDRGSNARPAPQTEAAPAPVVIQTRNWNDRRTVRSDEPRRTDRAATWSRQTGDRTYRDTARPGEYSRWQNQHREQYRREDDRRYNEQRWDGRSERSRYGYNQGQHRWDHRWRDNRRYDWYSYRRSYPSTFRIGVYYSPYRNYSYRRLSVGYFLNSLFFSNRYWINDPWQYRLPSVYGPYRWIRYYDDALLVDVNSGEVVDVIHSFFW